VTRRAALVALGAGGVLGAGYALRALFESPTPDAAPAGPDEAAGGGMAGSGSGMMGSGSSMMGSATGANVLLSVALISTAALSPPSCGPRGP